MIFKRDYPSFLLIFSVLMILSVSNIHGQDYKDNDDTIEITDQETIGGIDIVLLIDNSDSMYREYVEQEDGTYEPGDGPGNDVNQLRFDAVDHVLQRLIFFNSQLPQGVNHRLGVVIFGDQTEIILPLTSLETSGPEARNERFEELAAEIENYTNQRMSNTDPQVAYQEALSLWQDSPAPEKQTKVIALLTDGIPHTGQAGFSIGTYFEELDSWLTNNINQTTAIDDPDGYHLWVVGLGAEAKLARGNWTDMIGDSSWFEISNASQIPPTFNSILESSYSFKGTELEPGNFIMPPYLSNAAFSVFSSSRLEENDVVIQDQNDDEISCDDIQVRCNSMGDNVRWMEVSNPEPGLWDYQAISTDKVKVHFDRLFGKLNFQPIEPPPSQFSQAEITYKLINNSTGLPISEQEGYPLKIEGELINPSGIHSSLSFVPSDDGLYHSTTKIEFLERGWYRLVITGTANAGSEIVTVAPRQVNRFMVVPLSAKVVPQDTTLIAVSQFNVRLQIFDGGGKPIDDEVAEQLTLRGEIRETEYDNLTFQYDKNGVFESNNSFTGFEPDDYDLSYEGKSIETNESLFDGLETAFTISRISAKLLEPTTETPLLPFIETPIRLEMIDSNNERIETIDNNAVTLKAFIKDPAGHSDEIRLTLQSNGEYEGSYFLPQENSQYALTIEGETEIDGEPVTLFRPLSEDFNVAETFIERSLSTDDECIPEKSAVELNFEWQIANQQPVNLNTPLDFSGSWMRKVSNSEEYPIKPVLGADGILRIPVTLPDFGEWRLHLEGTVKDDIVAIDHEETICVIDVKPIGIRIVSPDGESPLPLQDGPNSLILFEPELTEHIVEFELYDTETDEPVPFTEISQAPITDVIQAKFEQSTPDEVIFSEDSMRIQCRFTGIDTTGPYNVKANLATEQAIKTGYIWDSEQATNELEVVVENSYATQGIIASSMEVGTILALIIGAVYLVILYTNPMQGALVFAAPGSIGGGTPVALPKRRWGKIPLPPVAKSVSNLKASNSRNGIQLSWEEKSPEGKVIKRSKEITPQGRERIGPVNVTYESSQVNPRARRPGPSSRR